MMRKRKSAQKDSQSGRRRAGRKAPGLQTAAAMCKFPVVGLGASAGGLEALEEFFSHVPPNSGMAFIVVTHQHPGHTSLLPELLGKYTRMPVLNARNGQRVRPGCIYLSRAERNLGILNGILQLVEFDTQDRVHLPIDHFFRSLAADQDRRAIGVILSGTGSDGTLGSKAIKEAGGTMMAQSPESAKYSGMPHGAIATGLMDFVLPAGEIAERLAFHMRKTPLPGMEAPQPVDHDLPGRLQRVVFLLRNRTGHDFSPYKATTISRRVERRMHLHQIKSIPRYLLYLQDNPHEADLLFKELLIGVTSFFRDPDAFLALTRKVLPDLLRSKPEGSVVRVWVAGCSTGEEAYTLAMVLRDCAERIKKRVTIQVFATDLDAQAIDAARAGLYPAGIAKDVPREQLARYFVKEDRHYRLKKSIRELVVFAKQNVIRDPPFTKLDLLACRNLLIYLNSDVQKRLLALFHYALKPDGLLLLGPSESISEFSRHFAVVDKKWRIFARKKTVPGTFPPMEFPLRPLPAGAGPTGVALADATREPRAEAIFGKLLASRFIPAAVVINAQGDISYIHGQTGSYLEPAPGQPRLNLLEMAREGLRLELGAAVHQAATQDTEVVHQGVRIKINGGFEHVNVTVLRLSEPELLRGLFLVTFQPVPAPAGRRGGEAAQQPSKGQLKRLQTMERELRFTRESLRSTVEELQSSNEELQSTNEELQSSNEELETSREEMQSLNEELQTVNAQLQTKVDALSETNDDMQNLLNSTSIATLFLDTRLKIKRFTEQARSVVNLIPSDVGRPISDLVSNLNYDQLEADALEVLRTLHSREREVQNKQGDWRLVRMLPYRTTENLIDGLVVTFVDINRLKQAEQAAQKARLLAESIVATLREPVLVLDKQLNVITANRAFYRFFRVTRAEVEQKRIFELGNGQWTNARLRHLLDQILSKNAAFEDFNLTHNFPRIGRKILLLNARRLQEEPEQAGVILLAIEDISEKSRAGLSKPSAGARRKTRSPAAGRSRNP
jgi:two-component system CheB/CheR fusion protein